MLVPPAVVTVMSTVPEPVGATALIRVGEITVKEAVGAPPKRTAVVPVRAVPSRTTVLPPVSGPESGATVASAGAATKV
nr:MULTISPECIES: hypothetical protein [Nocardia]